jgi:hypothetical protein
LEEIGRRFDSPSHAPACPGASRAEPEAIIANSI